MSGKLLTTLVGLCLCLPPWPLSAVTADKPTHTPEPQWIVHPGVPGPDAPLAGRSLFDQLFASHKSGQVSYLVPFPFEALRASLTAQLEQGQSAALLQVLIPQGRSLHREAAAPDYYKSPRVILAVEAQPQTLENEAGLSLSRKFYLGYQARAEQLEVISYNQEAGRFEFQVVENYAAGKTPRVRYANRALCMSCHQNGGPIFSTTPWRETNFDTNIALRLAAAQPQRYTSAMAALSGHHAALIDYSTDRANYFSPYQLLWQQACGGENPDDEASVRCRAGIVKAILQYRLSRDIAYDHTDTRYARDMRRAFYANWRARWPAGLYVATADIPDRSPLETLASNPALDPLLQRPPQAFWPEPLDMVAGGMVTRLSEFITDADIRRYDKHLAEVSPPSARASFSSVCEIQAGTPRLSGSPIKFVCGNNHSVRAYIELIVQANQVLGGHIFELHLPGEIFLWSTYLDTPSVTKVSGQNVLQATLGRSGEIHSRVADGRRLETITLEWQGEDYSIDLIGAEAKLTITLMDEFGPLDEAIETMVDETLTGKSDALASKPFRRRPIVSDLNRHLGVAALQWCCDLPPVSNDQLTVAESLNNNTFQDFRVYCGLCHSANQRYPPGFLHGSESDIKRHLSECAPRILRRLALWDDKSTAWPRSPMPPPPSLPLVGHDETTWAASNTLSKLVRATRALLSYSSSNQVNIAALDGDYDALPPCAPH